MKKKYPIRDMQIGDAFDIPIGSVNERSLRNYVSERGRITGMVLSVRRIDDEGVIEVSRVADRADKAAPVAPLRKARKQNHDL